ncbi:unnamed protein product, partial [Scytosiphon promiscuus]
GPIPKELGALSKLEQLYLDRNGFTGEELKRSEDLTCILPLNYLISLPRAGPIPPELGKLTSLEKLDLLFNQLTGPIPSELGHLSALKKLDLSNNQLSGESTLDANAYASIDLRRSVILKMERRVKNLFVSLSHLICIALLLTGPIPPELGKLGALTWLKLPTNYLSGAIPAQFGALDKLVRLDLSFNQLRG